MSHGKTSGADSDKVSVVVHDMDIDIKVNNYNRCIPLPNTLRGAQVTDVRFAENKLQISLKTKDVSEDAGKDVKQS